MQEALRQVVSSTGHEQRLAREGMVMKNGVAPSEDAVKQERLVVEVASGIKMLEMGLPARLSDESLGLADYWCRELKENPNLMDALESDVNNALDGDGPIAPERAGTVPAGALVNLCFSGKYSQRDVLKMLAGKGGLVAHLNQNSVQQICIDIEKGDQKSKAVLDAMSYSIAKEIGAMAAVLKGQVDAILLTGGVAYNEPVNDVIREHCSFLAPIFIYPGEDEMGALMLNARSVLRGERTPKVYA